MQRVPPNNEEAEQSVLGCMLLDRDAIFRSGERLAPGDFYREANARIFQAMVDLNHAGQPVDLLTLTEELRRRAQLDGVGGLDYVTSLVTVVPSSAHLETYIRIVLEKAVLRALSAAAGRLLNRVHESGDPVDDIVADAERQILEIGQRRADRTFQSLKQVLDSTLDQIETIHNSQGRLRGVPTGFADLDNLTAGFQASDLIILAGRPSMGKTQLGLNFAAQATIEAGRTCAMFSLEMSAEQLAMRLLAAEARIDSQRLRTGQLLDEHWKRLGQALVRLQDAKLYIDDTPGISVADMRARCRRLKQEAGLDLVIVDYLQLMSGRQRSESRQQEISEISRQMKALARELHVPVIALSQLSRAVESRQDKRPMLSDLRESGAIEQDSDLVMFIYRDDYYNPDTDRPNVTEVIIAKQRNGPVGRLELVFLKEYGTFAPLDRRHDSGAPPLTV